MWKGELGVLGGSRWEKNCSITPEQCPISQGRLHAACALAVPALAQVARATAILDMPS